VARAKVSLKAIPKTKVIEAISDAEGRFDFRSLAPGNYEISVTAPGFLETKETEIFGRI
jgi:protocatechuate 3,4-dioxygenase beta subunit